MSEKKGTGYFSLAGNLPFSLRVAGKVACPLFFLLLGGCASVGPTGRFRSLRANPPHDNRVVYDFEAHRNDFVFQEVGVVESDEQAGLVMVDGNLRSMKGADIEVLGTFELEAQRHTPFAFTDYTSIWRKLLCWPQVPLVWLTLGMWLLMPSSWFCWSRTPASRDSWMQWVKQMADSAGGNLAVVEFAPRKHDIDEAKGHVVRTVKQ
jgi:hypothetical protein